MKEKSAMKVPICKSGIITCVILLLASNASAVSTTWTGTTANWSAGSWDNGEPTPSVDAYINNGGTAQITSGNDEYCAYLYLGYNTSSEAGTVDISGGSLTASSRLIIGRYGSGTLKIANGGTVSSYWDYIARYAGSTGAVTVDGTGSSWTTTNYLYVGRYGNGTMDITGGGLVTSTNNGFVGVYSGSTGGVSVKGSDSTWKNNNHLYVGNDGSGTLEIFEGGLVSVAGDLYIDNNGGNDSFIDMKTGGMLAVDGNADDSIADFLGLVYGTDAIRYWNGSAWDDINNATEGVDYWLEYQTTGDLSGYTKLTVGVPEPGTFLLLLLGGLALLRRRR